MVVDIGLKKWNKISGSGCEIKMDEMKYMDVDTKEKGME